MYSSKYLRIFYYCLLTGFGARRPYAFLERFDVNFTPNTTDLGGRRYTYRAQPEIGHWNVAQLGNALIAGGLLNLVRSSRLTGTTRVCDVGVSAMCTSIW